jgi:hypothetical protein
MSLLDDISGVNVGDLLTGGVQYYQGQQAIEDVLAQGQAQQEALTGVGQVAQEAAEFKPFTVTTGLGTTSTTPEGGIAVGLSPEQQALQQQLLGQAAGLFGQVGVSPAEAQANIYEQIRATQRPEEERQRLAMEERLLSQGRLGLQSAAYGGASPELLAMETARQEAMARANLSARGQALAEQQQALAGATGLLGAGYAPQQQALAALQAGTDVASLADIGRRTGAQFMGQAALGGVEASMQSQQLANELRMQQQDALVQAILGQQPTIDQLIQAKAAGFTPEQLEALGGGGLFSSLGTLGGLFEDIGGLFGIGS